MSAMNRRLLLAAALAGTALPACSRQPAAVPGELVLWGPPAGPTITLAYAVASGLTDGLAEAVRVRTWRTPDELRAGLTSGTMSVAVMPLNTAASLYARGQDVRLLSVMTDGLLHVVTADPTLTEVPQLAGRRVAIPYRRDAPDIVLDRILAFHGLEPGQDVTLRHVGSPVEAVQLMLTGAVDAAFVPEPAASAAVISGRVTGRRVRRAIDVQAQWRAVTGAADSTLPQAGLAVTGAFYAQNRARLDHLNRTLVGAAEAVNADPAAAAAAAAPVLGMPAPILEAAIPHSNLRTSPARAARAEVERYFAVIAQADPEVLGGGMPDGDFYL